MERGPATPPVPFKLEAMTPQARQRNAVRIAVAISKLGGVFLLALDRQSFGIGNFWLPLRLKRKVADLKPEILQLLCACAQKSEVVLPVEGKSAPRPMVN